jgi:hypothetical protein
MLWFVEGMAGVNDAKKDKTPKSKDFLDDRSRRKGRLSVRLKSPGTGGHIVSPSNQNTTTNAQRHASIHFASMDRKEHGIAKSTVVP